MTDTCVLMFMCYTVCYFTGIFYAVERQISMLLIDNKDSSVCILYDPVSSLWPLGIKVVIITHILFGRSFGLHFLPTNSSVRRVNE